MNVNQLSAAQLDELAQSYLCEHYHDINPDAAELEGPSYGELADALDIVGRGTLMREYAYIDFVPDDFFSTATQPQQERRPIRFEIRQVDAWNDGDGWTCNDSYSLGNFVTTAQNESRAFYRALARLGIRFYRGRVRAVDDGWTIEIIDRKTGAPLFVAIPQEG